MKSLNRRKKLSGSYIEAIFTELDRTLPNPRCELYYETPFQLLTSVILSAQTTDKMVNRCMEPVYKKSFDAKTVLKLGEEGLLNIIRSIGLAPTKSKNVYKMAQILSEKYQGKVPDTREALEALPGVGRKTANVVLGEIFGQPTLAVDTHVFRVSRRLGLHNESSPEKCEQVLLTLIPAERLPKAHHQLIHLGRYVCKAIRPDCPNCSLNQICPKVGVAVN